MVGRCGAPGAHSRAVVSPATTRQGPPGGPGGLGRRKAPQVLSDKPSALVEVPLFPGALSSGALLASSSVEVPARSYSGVGDRSGQFLWWSRGGRRGRWRCRRFRGGPWLVPLMGWELGRGSGRSGGACDGELRRSRGLSHSGSGNLSRYRKGIQFPTTSCNHDRVVLYL